MGALLHKPSQTTYRTWELDPFATLSYLEFAKDNRITVYTFANKAVRILSSFTWISDRIRYSYDGFHKQRINRCFFHGEKISWYDALSVLTEYLVNTKVVLHWSALEPNCIYDIYNFLSKVSDSIFLPYSNYSNLKLLKNKKYKNKYNFFKYNLKENAPTLNVQSFTSSDIKEDPIPTSLDETERTPLTGGFNFDVDQKSTVVLVQTEQLTSLNEQTIYFGSHGFVNANKLKLIIPILLPYERANQFTGKPFLKGPSAAKAYHEVTTILMQLYSLAVGNWSYRTKRSFFYKFKTFKKINIKLLKDYSATKLMYKKFSFKNFLHFSNDAPELLVSEIQRCLLK